MAESAGPGAGLGGFGSARGAFVGGLRRALGVPALVLASSYLGFGALVQQVGFSVWQGLFSTATGWALPGQVALLELYAVGASFAVIGGAVALVNARLLPMTITMMPLLRGPRWPRWAYYLAAHWIAVTAWAAGLRDLPRLPEDERLPYFFGLAWLLWGSTLTTTVIGYHLAGQMPLEVTLGLVFVNPIYFMLVFAAEVRARPRVLALLLGALMGPPAYLLSPEWSLPATGLIAGSAALGLHHLLARRAAGGGHA